MFCEKTHGLLLVGAVPGGACTGREKSQGSLLETRPVMLHRASLCEHGRSNQRDTLGSQVPFTGQMNRDLWEEEEGTRHGGIPGGGQGAGG